MTPVEKLLTPARECRVFNADVTMHWYPEGAEAGSPCYCAKVRMEADTPETWDIGDEEPDGVTGVEDYTAEDYDGEGDPPGWGHTTSGDWKGYKNGGKVYLDWPELVRRWGPLRRSS